jgi:hypothetical protein
MTTFSYIIVTLYENYLFDRYIVSTRDTLKMRKSEWGFKNDCIDGSKETKS